MNSDRRPLEALLSEDVRLPYSKGLMARTLMGTGIRPERAYELARLIEGELVRGHEDEAVGAERLYDVAASVLAEHENGEAVLLLRRLQALRELDLPIVLLVGGATGTGKSTVATEIAHRLGITRVTSTDTVRQTMRAFFAQRFMPSIHYSSFEAGPALRIHEGEEADAALLGFKEQTRNVLVGVKAVIARALEERYSLAVEGVHLVPGALPRSYDGAVVVQCMLAIADEDEHARHFWIRDAGSQGLRPMQKYLRSLPEIRRIQDYLVERAEKAGVPVIENARMETALNAIIHLVLAEVERARDQAQSLTDDVRCRCEAYAAVTERAAIAGARWLGRGDVKGAEESAATAMREGLDALEITGRVVVGGDEEADALAIGGTVGSGGAEVDLAVDPLEGRAVVARGDYGAMSMIAVGESGSFPRLPQMYMRKMAVGPVARGRIDLGKSVGENVASIAEAYGRRPADITAIVLDRPRHHDLIEEIRASGARIKLIQDGDVTASITASVRGTNDHLAVGIGGARQAVLSAAALRCLGGELQAQFWPTSRDEIEQAREHGIDDLYKVFETDELAPGEVIVAATGVTNGDLLRGVRFLTDSARSHSLVMCTRHNWVRFIDGIHFFARERREEVRLLG